MAPEMSTEMSLRSVQVGELLAASKLEVLSMSLFDSSNVEIALECTHVGKRFCPVTLYPRRLYRITFGDLANVTLGGVDVWTNKRKC